jgi:hypothetical protein
VRSHLMSSALYKLCAPPGGKPIAFNSEIVLESSRELQHPLLCFDCEDILNRGGEEWMVPLFARFDGLFPFHELMAQEPPAVVDGHVKVFAAAKNPRLDTGKITHFAMGIFWKAAVHSWRGDRTQPLIDLEPYTQEIRRYLRSEAPFPVEAILMVGVVPPPVRHIAFTLPYKGSSDAGNNFVLYVLGIEFTLLIGKAITEEQRSAAFTGNPAKPIIVVDFQPMMQEIAAKVMKGARKARNVEKYINKH